MSNTVVEIQTIGAFELRRGEDSISLPTSRKTRALLSYLAITGRKHTRQSLCELFWDSTDDPLAGLRWSLSKLRGLLNDEGSEVIKSDREAVWVDLGLVALDKDQLNELANRTGFKEKHADEVWRATSGQPLEGCEIPSLASYSIWVESYRQDYRRLRGSVAKRMARDTTLPWQIRDKWAERWVNAIPYSRGAAYTAFECKHFAAGRPAAEALATYLERSFREAGIEPPEFAIDQANDTRRNPRDELVPVEQQIRFVEGHDGVSIAWASVGDTSNPPLVKAANWLNHLELDWDAPIWSPLFKELSRSHHLIRYDERGCGLSDWSVDEISFDKFVEDLEQVVDAAGLDRFPLLGISQGAAVSIRFAALYPERVSKLVLFGAYDQGWRFDATPEQVREREAVMVLTETGWGMDNPAYRHVFSRTFMPEASAEELDWFDEFQRLTTSSENAVRFLEAFSSINVSDDLDKIQCPTLVVHSRGDMRIPFATGRSLASRIPGAQLAGLDSQNHLLLGRESASLRFVELVNDFLTSG
ncbi:alpha/beta hydrolase [Altererythrobacter lutimaris]|uniref:Alpha/beta fold hydrolase n=1 Tax=Altererythrobacter lutimaris TaxID=2743979 RepID=A0A850HB17_9SPHN|nr:alpha/beta hydrolase [Altererythrobacter lutimaris]NVE94939.1 alpha/beta fold hydrolase [Altererythrobacter lutimaris]